MDLRPTLRLAGEAVPGRRDRSERGPGPVDEVEIASEELMAGHRRLRIRHADQVYLLRVTRQGKLLLTK